MISAYLKEHDEHVYEIKIVADCRVIETVITNKLDYHDQLKHLIDKYGNLAVTEYT